MSSLFPAYVTCAFFQIFRKCALSAKTALALSLASWITLSALRENKPLLCNFQCLESPCGSRDSSWSPSGEPPFRLMTFRCDIGHIANCIHWPKTSLLLYSLSLTLFYPGLRPTLALEHDVLNRGSFAFQRSLLSPLSLHHQPKLAGPDYFFFFLPLESNVDNLISNVGIVFLLTFQGCGSEGLVYRGVDICRHNVTCPGLGWNLSPMQPDRPGLLVWREAQAEVLHVIVTLCVKSRCWDFPNESANECTANRRSHTWCFGCNWAGESWR